MKVAGYQMCVNDGDINENHQKISSAIRYASENGADILLTPEGSLSGYHPSFNQKEVSEALQDLCNQAKSLNIGLALGTCYYESPDRCFNQIRFYEKDGSYMGCHAKTLLCSGQLDEPYADEMITYSTKSLEVFCFQGEWVGGLICNDMWANPTCTPLPDIHLSHLLAKMGAKVIFHAVNGGRGDQESIDLNRAFHESNQRLRAITDHLYIVTVDNAFPLTKENSCSSGVISPEGKYLSQLPKQGEGIFIQEIL